MSGNNEPEAGEKNHNKVGDIVGQRLALEKKIYFPSLVLAFLSLKHISQSFGVPFLAPIAQSLCALFIVRALFQDLRASGKANQAPLPNKLILPLALLGVVTFLFIQINFSPPLWIAIILFFGIMVAIFVIFYLTIPVLSIKSAIASKEALLSKSAELYAAVGLFAVSSITTGRPDLQIGFLEAITTGNYPALFAELIKSIPFTLNLFTWCIILVFSAGTLFYCFSIPDENGTAGEA